MASEPDRPVSERDPNTEAREIIHEARMATDRDELWDALVEPGERDPLEVVAAALEQAGRALEKEHTRCLDERDAHAAALDSLGRLNQALEKEREKVRIKDEALDFIAVVNDALPARKYAERTIELMRRRAREALASSPGDPAAETETSG